MAAVLPSTVACQFLTAASAAHLDALLRHTDSGSEIAAALDRYPLEGVVRALYAMTEPTTYSHLPAAVWSTFEAVGRQYGAAVLGRYKKRLVARLIGDIDSRIGALDLTPAMRANYPDMLDYVVADLHAIDDAHYLDSRDKILRELRLCALHSVPVGARVMDLRGKLPPTIYRYHGIRTNLRCLWFVYGRMGGLAPIYRDHIEERYVSRLGGAGVIDMYLDTAELLLRHRDVRGVVGTSWTLDPQLDSISPHLTFTRRLRVAAGAYLHYEGPGEIHTRRAIATSRTRRQLYEAGKYLPTCYSVIWARQDLIGWAERHTADGGAATMALADEVFGPGGKGHPLAS